MNTPLTIFLTVSAITIWAILAFSALGLNFQARLEPQQLVRILALIASILSLIFVVLGIRNIEDFYANLATELGGIAITIIVIDRLYEWRTEEQEKRRVIEQMGSPSNDFAIEALRLITKNGWLRDGSLQNANFSLADLMGGYLVRADLRGTTFINARLENASFEDSCLEKANFTNAHLESALFTYARLKEVSLLGANASASSWIYADLEAADLSLVTFRQANLRYANFQKASLVGTNFEGAHLGGANFLNTDLQRAFMKEAKYTRTTLWPVNFDPGEHGAILVEEDWPISPHRLA